MWPESTWASLVIIQIQFGPFSSTHDFNCIDFFSSQFSFILFFTTISPKCIYTGSLQAASRSPLPLHILTSIMNHPNTPFKWPIQSCPVNKASWHQHPIARTFFKPASSKRSLVKRCDNIPTTPPLHQ
jgi:hypothetical protein